MGTHRVVASFSPAADTRVAGPDSGRVLAGDRLQKYGHRGGVLWFSGLSGSGKSTLARAVELTLFNDGWHVCVLDGDLVRQGLNKDLGFSPADRTENLRRGAEVARLLAEAGLLVISAFISPRQADRDLARDIVTGAGGGVPFVEVYLSTPLGVCEARDPKGLYARARQGTIAHFTGVSAPFDPPERPDLRLDTSRVTVDRAAAIIMEYVVTRVGHP